MSHQVNTGDIWRMCAVKDLPIRDWVKLAVGRARATGAPAVFWLNESRAHDRELIAKVRSYLNDHDTDGLQIEIMSPVEATKFSVDRIRRGEDTISVTGNVLRLSHRPLPHSRTRYERQDALDRSSDERWRTL